MTMRLVELHSGDTFTFLDDHKTSYEVEMVVPEGVYAEYNSKFYKKIAFFPFEKFRSSQISLVRNQVQSGSESWGFLKEKEDYPEFLKYVPIRTQSEKILVRYAFDIWRTLRTVIDLLAPFAWIFLKNPKLKQAFQLLKEVVFEKTAMNYIDKENISDFTQEIEEHLLDQKKSIKELTASELLRLVEESDSLKSLKSIKSL